MEDRQVVDDRGGQVGLPAVFQEAVAVEQEGEDQAGDGDQGDRIAEGQGVGREVRGLAALDVAREDGLETAVQIMIREYIGDALYDCTSYARFYDLMEKRDGVWRISEWQTIYDKDRVDPVVPSAVPAPFYAQAAFKGADSGFAFMKLRQAMKGRTVPASLVIAGTEAEAKLRQRGANWLASAKV